MVMSCVELGILVRRQIAVVQMRKQEQRLEHPNQNQIEHSHKLLALNISISQLRSMKHALVELEMEEVISEKPEAEV